jgi:hypothetical protein
VTGPTRAPRHATSHRGWRRAYITNSRRGSVLAQRAHRHWTDNDFHLTEPSEPAATDCAWCNAHGAPERFWLPRGDRFEHHTAVELFKRDRVYGGHLYHLRNAREALVDNHEHGLGTEFEVKDVRPWNTPEILDAAFGRLATHALEVYGPDWRRHLVVKVLTNLGGGEAYALQICAAAHAHGIPTMLLARGRARFHTYAGHPEVTWVRGSAVIR